MLKRLVLAQVVLGLLYTTLAVAATPAPRSFAPVQSGFVDQTAPELPWAADRLLIKFTAEASQKAQLSESMNSADLSSALKNLPSLASALGQAGAVGIRAPQQRPANKAAASRVGADLWYRVDLIAGTDVIAAATSLAQNPNLEYALPDLKAYPAVTPNDPLYADSWGHQNTAQLPDLDWGGTYGHTLPTTVGTVGFDTDADLAWDESQGYGSSSVIIAILDSGVDTGHADLNLVAGYDYGDNDNNPFDDSAQAGHGTACAGVAAGIANNNLGVAGIAGGCRVMPLKVADSAGTLSFSYIVDAVYHAADNGADIISMSFGAATTAYAPMDAAISYAVSQGVTLLAATGNENNVAISYPAYNPDVIGVGAASPCGERKRSSSSSGEVNPGVSTDPNGYTCDGERWWGSNYGFAVQDHQGAVDIIAPTILPTTDISGAAGYDTSDYSGFFNGTSCSTPYAAGVCALILSANPTFTPAQIRAQLVSTAEDVVSVESGVGWDRYTGYGMVDAAAAVSGGVVPAPVAGFSSSNPAGCEPLLVTFSDLSTGTIDTWSWTFGDGGTSTLANPNHTYTVAGTYTVSLTVTGPGGTDSQTQVDLVTVTGAPVASFANSTPTILVGGSVSFIDTSVGATSWAWDFGDGGTSTMQNPSHNYSLPGTYTVELVASNSCFGNTFASVDLVTVLADEIHAVISPASGISGAVSIFALPDGSGTPLTAVRQWSGTIGDPAVFVDGSIKVSLTDAFGDPVVGFPAADITIAAQAGGWSLCSALTADAATDINGEAVISGALAGGGYSSTGELMVVDINTPMLASTSYPGGLAGLEYFVNSGDINGDYMSNLIDIPLFAIVYYSGSYDYKTDFAWNGVVNLSDITTLAIGLGTECLVKAQAAPSDEDVSMAGSLGLVFDTHNNKTSRTAAPGEMIDAYLVLSGMAASEGIGAFAAQLRTSENVVVHERNIIGQALDLSQDGSLVGGYATPRSAEGNAPLKLMHLRISVTDESPAHFWLEAGQMSGLDDPAVVLGDEMAAVRPVSGSVTAPVAALNDEEFALAGETPVASHLTLSIAPNPFNPMTEIRFSLPTTGQVDLRIFDTRGKLVKTLAGEVMTAGVHTLVWNGIDHSGRRAASGVYFSNLRTDAGTVMQKMMLVK